MQHSVDLKIRLVCGLALALVLAVLLGGCFDDEDTSTRDGSDVSDTTSTSTSTSTSGSTPATDPELPSGAVVVGDGDTLASLVEERCDSSTKELIEHNLEINRSIQQGDGQYLLEARDIETGWLLFLDCDAPPPPPIVCPEASRVLFEAEGPKSRILFCEINGTVSYYGQRFSSMASIVLPLCRAGDSAVATNFGSAASTFYIVDDPAGATARFDIAEGPNSSGPLSATLLTSTEELSVARTFTAPNSLPLCQAELDSSNAAAAAKEDSLHPVFFDSREYDPPVTTVNVPSPTVEASLQVCSPSVIGHPSPAGGSGGPGAPPTFKRVEHGRALFYAEEFVAGRSLSLADTNGSTFDLELVDGEARLPIDYTFRPGLYLLLDDDAATIGQVEVAPASEVRHTPPSGNDPHTVYGIRPGDVLSVEALLSCQPSQVVLDDVEIPHDRGVAKLTFTVNDPSHAYRVTVGDKSVLTLRSQ